MASPRCSLMESVCFSESLGRRRGWGFGGERGAPSTLARGGQGTSKSSSISCFHHSSSRLSKNSSEVQAAREAVAVAGQERVKKLVIKTDSQFLVNCAGWLAGWKVGGGSFWRNSAVVFLSRRRAG